MFYVTSEIYLNNDLGSLAVSVDNYPQKRKNHLTITYNKCKVQATNRRQLQASSASCSHCS